MPLLAALMVAGCMAAPSPKTASPEPVTAEDASAAASNRSLAPVVDPWHRVGDLRTEPRSAWQVSIDAPVGSWLFQHTVAIADAAGVTGYDTGTGAERWYVPAADGRCNATSTLLTCVTAGGALATIDPATGTVTTVEVPGAFAGVGVGEDLVLWRASEAGTVVERHSGTDVLWSQPSALTGHTAITVINGIVLAAGGGDNGTGDVLDASTGTRVHPDLRQANRLNQSRWLVFTEAEVWEIAAGRAPRSVDYSREVLIADSDPDDPLPPDRSDETLGPFTRVGGVSFHSFPEHGPTAFTARELATGAELWGGPAIRTRDNLIWVDATTLAVAPANGGLRALDARTGDELWGLVPGTDVRRVLSDGESLVVISDRMVWSWSLGA